MSALRIPILIFFFMCSVRLSAAVDTIRVNASGDCRDFMPKRVRLSVPCSTCNPVTFFEYDDSIRVCGQIIDGFRKYYYLIVYDSYGVKRMEGDFWDHLPSGHSINYDFRGRKISAGDYKLVKKKGYYYPSVKTGTWRYYDISGKVIKKEEFNLVNVRNFTNSGDTFKIESPLLN